MVTPAGVLLADFIFSPRLFRLFVCFFFSRVIGASTPASSLKMPLVRNKGENVDEKSAKFVQRFTVTEHVSGISVITCQKGETKAKHGWLENLMKRLESNFTKRHQS